MTAPTPDPTPPPSPRPPIDEADEQLPDARAPAQLSGALSVVGSPCSALAALRRERARERESERTLPQAWSAGPRDWDLRTAEEWKWEETGDAVLAYGALVGTLLVGQSGLLGQFKGGDLPYFVSLAVCTIYVGSHRALTSKARQNISLGQGALAPVLASVSLFGAYLVIKFLPDLDLQSVINAYFWLLGCLAVAGALPGPLKTLGGPLGAAKVEISVPEGMLINEKGEFLDKADVSLTDVLAVALGVAAASADLACGHTNFTLNNLIACLIAADLLQLVGLKSFKAAGALLVGMALYDVFWVFGSTALPTDVVGGDSVMVTVATSQALTGPIKLLFPRPGIIPGDFPWQILGLGDIAIPGLLACLALRYDASRTPDMRSRGLAAADAIMNTTKKLPKGMKESDVMVALGDAALDAYDEMADADDLGKQGRGGEGAVDVPSVPRETMNNRKYFGTVVLAYVVGLLFAFGANAVTKMGQPALLYLTPATLGALIVASDNGGDFQRLLAYEDKTKSPVELFEEAERKRKEEEGEEGRAGDRPDWWPFK